MAQDKTAASLGKEDLRAKKPETLSRSLTPIWDLGGRIHNDALTAHSPPAKGETSGRSTANLIIEEFWNILHQSCMRDVCQGSRICPSRRRIEGDAVCAVGIIVAVAAGRDTLDLGTLPIRRWEFEGWLKNP